MGIFITQWFLKFETNFKFESNLQSMKIAQRFLQFYKNSSYRFIKHLRYFTAYKLSGGTDIGYTDF
jgi:hypothetical protein